MFCFYNSFTQPYFCWSSPWGKYLLVEKWYFKCISWFFIILLWELF